MLSSAPEFTIGICFRNPGKHFELALKSVFAQTYPNWELLLLNDISSDGALELALTLDDERVRVLNDGRGKSLNLRLNEMVRAARGRYFVRMDADDVMHPERLQKQLASLQDRGDNTVLGSATYAINVHDEIIGFRPAPKQQRTDFKARHSFHHPTVTAATAWFLRNPYSEHFVYSRSEDAELWCRTSASSTFLNSNERLLFYREAFSSFTAYIQSELALIHLLRERFSKPRGPYLQLLTKEMVKLWGASALEAFGKESLLLKRRYKPIDSSSRREAEELLRKVKATPLPIASREPVTQIAWKA